MYSYFLMTKILKQKYQTKKNEQMLTKQSTMMFLQLFKMGTIMEVIYLIRDQMTKFNRMKRTVVVKRRLQIVILKHSTLQLIQTTTMIPSTIFSQRQMKEVKDELKVNKMQAQKLMLKSTMRQYIMEPIFHGRKLMVPVITCLLHYCFTLA